MSKYWWLLLVALVSCQFLLLGFSIGKATKASERTLFQTPEEDILFVVRDGCLVGRRQTIGGPPRTEFLKSDIYRIYRLDNGHFCIAGQEKDEEYLKDLLDPDISLEQAEVLERARKTDWSKVPTFYGGGPANENTSR